MDWRPVIIFLGLWTALVGCGAFALIHASLRVMRVKGTGFRFRLSDLYVIVLLLVFSLWIFFTLYKSGGMMRSIHAPEQAFWIGTFLLLALAQVCGGLLGCIAANPVDRPERRGWFFTLIVILSYSLWGILLALLALFPPVWLFVWFLVAFELREWKRARRKDPSIH